MELHWTDLSERGKAWLRGWGMGIDGAPDWVRIKAAVWILIGGRPVRRVARRLGIVPEEAEQYAKQLREAMADALAFEGMVAADFLVDPRGVRAGQMVAVEREIEREWGE